jgi:hypothetical protein
MRSTSTTPERTFRHDELCRVTRASGPGGWAKPDCRVVNDKLGRPPRASFENQDPFRSGTKLPANLCNPTSIRTWRSQAARAAAFCDR